MGGVLFWVDQVLTEEGWGGGKGPFLTGQLVDGQALQSKGASGGPRLERVAWGTVILLLL